MWRYRFLIFEWRRRQTTVANSVTRHWIKKSCPNVSKSCQNNIHSSFYTNWSSSKWHKSLQSFWATFVSDFVVKNFQNLPNLVTLILTDFDLTVWRKVSVWTFRPRIRWNRFWNRPFRCFKKSCRLQISINTIPPYVIWQLIDHL